MICATYPLGCGPQEETEESSDIVGIEERDDDDPGPTMHGVEVGVQLVVVVLQCRKGAVCERGNVGHR